MAIIANALSNRVSGFSRDAEGVSLSDFHIPRTLTSTLSQPLDRFLRRCDPHDQIGCGDYSLASSQLEPIESLSHWGDGDEGCSHVNTMLHTERPTLAALREQCV